MARNTIVQGPSRWDLTLAFFDEKPPMAHGARDCTFKLKNGINITVHMRGLVLPSDPLGLWALTGEAFFLPVGYSYSETGEMVIEYDPIRRTGHVELEMSSPCCGAEICFTQLGTVGVCATCDSNLMAPDVEGIWRWNSGREVEFLEDPSAESTIPEIIARYVGDNRNQPMGSKDPADFPAPGESTPPGIPTNTMMRGERRRRGPYTEGIAGGR